MIVTILYLLVAALSSVSLVPEIVALTVALDVVFVVANAVVKVYGADEDADEEDLTEWDGE